MNTIRRRILCVLTAVFLTLSTFIAGNVEYVKADSIFQSSVFDTKIKNVWDEAEVINVTLAKGETKSLATIDNIKKIERMDWFKVAVTKNSDRKFSVKGLLTGTTDIRVTTKKGNNYSYIIYRITVVDEKTGIRFVYTEPGKVDDTVEASKKNEVKFTISLINGNKEEVSDIAGTVIPNEIYISICLGIFTL